MVTILPFEVVQQDVFEMVGLPMVENCLSGFNSSIFAYGQVRAAYDRGVRYTIDDRDRESRSYSNFSNRQEQVSC